MGPTVPELFPLLPEFLNKLHGGVFVVPRGDGGGGTVSTETSVNRTPTPGLFMVEEWAVSSFLGDYGLGRTVKTMTLLPGEQLTLRIRTWRSSEESIKEASSVFDSASKEAQDRFQTEVLKETTDKRTKSRSEEWHAEASASGSWGFGSASVSGGGSGQYHSGREQFAKRVNDATREHARSESSKRETTVSSSSEATRRAEDEEVTERVIRNVNLRHTLNLVFRELNQSYDTYVHLRDLRVAYTDGTVNSWREVPISDLWRLLNDVLDPAAVDATAQAILKVAFRVFDVDGDPVTVLETRTWDVAAQDWSAPADAALDGTGQLSPPSDVFFYRFKRGPLGSINKAANTTVDGVVTNADQIVLRTDSLLGEALLGQADALDAYAMVSQRADADAKAITNARNYTINTALAKVPAADALEAYVKMMNASPARLDIRQVP
jgi:hypothetical protein